MKRPVPVTKNSENSQRGESGQPWRCNSKSCTKHDAWKKLRPGQGSGSYITQRVGSLRFFRCARCYETFFSEPASVPVAAEARYL